MIVKCRTHNDASALQISSCNVQCELSLRNDTFLHQKGVGGVFRFRHWTQHEPLPMFYILSLMMTFISLSFVFYLSYLNYFFYSSLFSFHHITVYYFFMHPWIIYTLTQYCTLLEHLSMLQDCYTLTASFTKVFHDWNQKHMLHSLNRIHMNGYLIMRHWHPHYAS